MKWEEFWKCVNWGENVEGGCVVAYSKHSPFIRLKKWGKVPAMEAVLREFRIKYFPDTVMWLWSLLKVQTGWLNESSYWNVIRGGWASNKKFVAESKSVTVKNRRNLLLIVNRACVYIQSSILGVPRISCDKKYAFLIFCLKDKFWSRSI